MASWLEQFAVSRPLVCRVLGVLAAAVLCGILGGEVASSARTFSATWDESYHLLAGYSYWQSGDYGINPEHPPLAKLVAAIPLLFMHLKAPRVGRYDTKPMAAVFGRALVYGNNADAILLWARSAEAVLGLLLILLLFEAGQQMFGYGAACMAAVLAVFEPNLTAHCALVTTDFALTCFLFAAVYALWRVVERSTWLRLVGCGTMTGLALASKHSALVLIPTFVVLAAVEIACRLQAAQPDSPGHRPSLWREAGTWAGRLVCIFTVAGIVLWGFYAYRYAARPDGMPLWDSVDHYTLLLRGHLMPALVRAAARYRVLPESYLFGLTDVLWITAGPRNSFLLGHLYSHALWYYFPVAFVIKSTLGFLGLLILCVAGLRTWSGEHHRKAAYLLIPPALFMGVALTAGTNLGIRHVLPIYPFLILAAAAGAWELARRHRAWSIVVACLVTFHAASSLRAGPDYLAYSNEIFGGKSQTYRRLSDSNVDWGQGLREARQYLARRNIKECWLAYFGSADPAYYHLPCKLLPDPFLRWWRAPVDIPPETYHGVLLISGTEIAAPYWGSQSLNPYSAFLHQRPVANIGGSILVFEGESDLRPAAATAHLYKAWDLVAGHDPEGSIQEALKAQELAPQHPGPPFLIGYILAQSKRTEAARIQLEESLRLAHAAHPDYDSDWEIVAKAQLALLP